MSRNLLALVALVIVVIGIVMFAGGRDEHPPETSGNPHAIDQN